MSGLRILLLSEGNPEDPSASGSGTPASVIRHLRARGTTVATGDIELYGARRAVAALATFSTERRRWRAKYHLSAVPFALRTANARRAVRSHPEIDAVLQYGTTFAASRPGGVPYFLYCDSNVALGSRDPDSSACRMTRRQLDRVLRHEGKVYRGASAVFTFSEYLRQSFLADYGLPPDRVVTVHAGANLDTSDAVRSVPPSGPPTVLFVGREFRRKGGDVLLAAFREVRRELPDARLIIIGPAEPQTNDPGVEHLGYLRKNDPGDAARLRAAYDSADVFCLPTRYEPFGIVMVEAMLRGLPVVATATWAVPEIVADGETGYVVPRDDAGALANRLVRVLRDRPLAARLGASGRERAARLFTWDRVTDTMLRVMNGVVNSSRGAAARASS